MMTLEQAESIFWNASHRQRQMDEELPDYEGIPLFMTHRNNGENAMMDIKPEGEPFRNVRELEIRHPARWCWLNFILSQIVHGCWRTPRGRAWHFDMRYWTCYMRLRPWPLRPSWQHRHDSWLDTEAFETSPKKNETAA